MISASAAFDAELARAARVPIYVVKLESPDGASTIYLFNLRPDNSAALVDGLPYLEPVSLSYKADPARSSFQLSAFRFNVFDFRGAATTEFGQTDITGWICTFYCGFAGLDWSSDYPTRYVGRVAVVDYEDNRYSIVARSVFAAALETRLHDAARMTLQAAMNETQTSMVVDENASGAQESGVVTVDLERIAYSGKVDNGNGTWTLTGLTRGLFGGALTGPATHAADETVYEVFIYDNTGSPEHPIDLLEEILTDTRPKAGLDLDSSFIDSAGFAAAKTGVGSFDNFYFEGVKGRNGKRFLEEQFFIPTASFPVENNLGQLRPALLDLPDSGDIVDSITDEHVIESPAYAGRFDRQVQEVLWESGVDIVTYTDSVDTFFSHRDEALIALAGATHTLKIRADALRRNVAGADAYDFMEERSQSYIDRFGIRLHMLRAKTALSLMLLEIADPVSCTFTDVRNAVGSSRSLDGVPHQIIGMEMQFQRGTIDFDLLNYAGITVTSPGFVSGDEIEADAEAEVVIG